MKAVENGEEKDKRKNEEKGEEKDEEEVDEKDRKKVVEDARQRGRGEEQRKCQRVNEEIKWR